MRRIITFAVVIISIFLLGGGAIYGAKVTFYSVKSNVKVTEIDSSYAKKSLINEIKKKTYGTDMIFIGKTDKWNVEYRVDKKLGSVDNEKKTKVIINSNGNYTGEISYNIETTQGSYSDKEEVKNNSIKIVEKCPVPLSYEDVELTINYGNSKDKIKLKNVYPKKIVSPDVVLEAAIDKYKEIYDTYPKSTFTYYVELLYDNNYWVVSYDDNDNVGGKAYILVDSVSGSAGDIKIEE